MKTITALLLIYFLSVIIHLLIMVASYDRETGEYTKSKYVFTPVINTFALIGYLISRI